MTQRQKITRGTDVDAAGGGLAVIIHPAVPENVRILRGRGQNRVRKCVDRAGLERVDRWGRRPRQFCDRDSSPVMGRANGPRPPDFGRCR